MIRKKLANNSSTVLVLLNNSGIFVKIKISSIQNIYGEVRNESDRAHSLPTRHYQNFIILLGLTSSGHLMR